MLNCRQRSAMLKLFIPCDNINIYSIQCNIHYMPNLHDFKKLQSTSGFISYVIINYASHLQFLGILQGLGAIMLFPFHKKLCRSLQLSFNFAKCSTFLPSESSVVDLLGAHAES